MFVWWFLLLGCCIHRHSKCHCADDLQFTVDSLTYWPDSIVTGNASNHDPLGAYIEILSLVFFTKILYQTLRAIKNPNPASIRRAELFGGQLKLLKELIEDDTYPIVRLYLHAVKRFAVNVSNSYGNVFAETSLKPWLVFNKRHFFPHSAQRIRISACDLNLMSLLYRPIFYDNGIVAIEGTFKGFPRNEFADNDLSVRARLTDSWMLFLQLKFKQEIGQQALHSRYLFYNRIAHSKKREKLQIWKSLQIFYKSLQCFKMGLDLIGNSFVPNAYIADLFEADKTNKADLGRGRHAFYASIIGSLLLGIFIGGILYGLFVSGQTMDGSMQEIIEPELSLLDQVNLPSIITDFDFDVFQKETTEVQIV